MIGRILWTALLAGGAAGLVATAVQAVEAVPMIQQAELALGEHGHGDGQAMRWAQTVLTNVLTGCGFALLLAAAMTLHGGPFDGGRGLRWGLAGFAAVHLAPALGLPAELPGSASAPLADQQAWWLATVLATALGLALAAFARRLTVKAVGVALIVAPHLVGAPQPPAGVAGSAPPELAAQFAVASLVMGAAVWATIGLILGKFLQPTIGDESSEVKISPR